MRCLVTGGAGFIGSHVVDCLREAGHEPCIFDLRHSPHALECENFIGSILDLEALRQAMNGIQAVFHLAAVADVNDVLDDPVYAEHVNTRGTICALEAARRAGVDRFLYGSTSWVYSDVKYGFVDEDTPIPPPSHLYAATKLAGEHYCRSYGSLYGLKCTIFRYGIPYGPRSRGKAVIPTFVKLALEGKPITIAGDGSQFRQFVYVKDLAEGNSLGLNPVAAGRTYNLDGERKVTVREIAECVQHHIGGVEIQYVPARSGDFSGKMVISERAYRELGWRARTEFGEGLAEYIRWYKERLNG